MSSILNTADTLPPLSCWWIFPYFLKPRSSAPICLGTHSFVSTSYFAQASISTFILRLFSPFVYNLTLHFCPMSSLGERCTFLPLHPSVWDLVKHSVQNQQRNKSMNECSFLEIEERLPQPVIEEKNLNSKKVAILEKVQNYDCYYGRILQSIPFYSTSQFLFYEDSSVFKMLRWT